MNEFLNMGGYAVYVWSAYGVTAVVLVGLLLWTLASLRRVRAELAQLEALAPRRRRRAAAVSPDAMPDTPETTSGSAPHAQS